MSSPLRHLSWVCSLAFHILVLVGGAYFAAGTHVKIDLNKKMYEVSLVGAPNKGKPGVRSAPRAEAQRQEARQKPAAKTAPEAKPIPEQKKPEKKATPPPDTAKAIPQETVNATKVAETKKEEQKSEAKKAPETKKEEPKTAEAKKDTAAKNATAKKTEKAPSREDILAQALSDASKSAKNTGSTSGGSSKSASKGSSKNALADALADAGKEVAGRGSRGDGTAEDGDGTGESSGTIDQWYASQVKKVIRANWRFPRVSNVVLATTMELRLNRSGEILSYRQISGSGRADFDSSVQRAVADTKRLPRVPESVGTTIVVTFYNTDNE